MLSPALPDPHEKEERSLLVFESPQTGQGGDDSPSEGKTSFSKH